MRPVAPWRVRAVSVESGHTLRVTFVDGTAGMLRMGPFLASARVAGTLFEELRDEQFFAKAEVLLGAVTWPNGADLAPDAMHEEISKHGHWTPE